VVRIGRPANVHTTLWNFTLDFLLQNEPLWQHHNSVLNLAISNYTALKNNNNNNFNNINNNNSSFYSGNGNNNNKNNNYWNNEMEQAKAALSKAKKKFQEIEQICIELILSKADVVVSTCIGFFVFFFFSSM
jgi:hypothetical protein